MRVKCSAGLGPGSFYKQRVYSQCAIMKYLDNAGSRSGWLVKLNDMGYGGGLVEVGGKEIGGRGSVYIFRVGREVSKGGCR